MNHLRVIWKVIGLKATYDTESAFMANCLTGALSSAEVPWVFSRGAGWRASESNKYIGGEWWACGDLWESGRPWSPTRPVFYVSLSFEVFTEDRVTGAGGGEGSLTLFWAGVRRQTFKSWFYFRNEKVILYTLFSRTRRNTHTYYLFY